MRERAATALQVEMRIGNVPFRETCSFVTFSWMKKTHPFHTSRSPTFLPPFEHTARRIYGVACNTTRCEKHKESNLCQCLVLCDASYRHFLCYSGILCCALPNIYRLHTGYTANLQSWSLFFSHSCSSRPQQSATHSSFIQSLCLG